MRFFIKDETVHAAFEILDALTEGAPIAKAMKERREDEKKAVKARAFLRAAGTVGEREATSLLDDDYKQACEAYYEAVERDEQCRREQSKAEAIIEAWRSCQANMRSMSKVG